MKVDRAPISNELEKQSIRIRFMKIMCSDTCRRCLAQILLLAAVFLSSPVARANDKSPCPGPGCLAEVDAWFAEEVWAKVGLMECIKCHRQGGDAEDTRLVLYELGLTRDDERKKLMALNRDAFVGAARLKSEDRSLLLAKVVGDLDHGGNQVLTRDSTGYRILEELVRRANVPSTSPSREMLTDSSELPFFDGVVMIG